MIIRPLYDRIVVKRIEERGTKRRSGVGVARPRWCISCSLGSSLFIARMSTSLVPAGPSLPGTRPAHPKGLRGAVQNLGVLLALGVQQFQYLHLCARRLHFCLQPVPEPEEIEANQRAAIRKVARGGRIAIGLATALFRVIGSYLQVHAPAGLAG
jgi:hypothetical protein